MTELKRLRLEKELTQKEAAKAIGISLRSYITYENDETKQNTTKYRFLVSEINKLKLLDEEHGILTVQDIQNICESIFREQEVDFCYLFGSYAKGKAKEISDVDLLISTTITGLRFYELAEKLRERLHKRVDLIDTKQLLKNEELLNEVLKDGIKVYG